MAVLLITLPLTTLFFTPHPLSTESHWPVFFIGNVGICVLNCSVCFKLTEVNRSLLLAWNLEWSHHGNVRFLFRKNCQWKIVFSKKHALYFLLLPPPPWPCLTLLSLLLFCFLLIYLWLVPFLWKGEPMGPRGLLPSAPYLTLSPWPLYVVHVCHLLNHSLIFTLPSSPLFLWLTSFLFYFIYFPPSFFRMTAHTIICTKTTILHDIYHNLCVLILYFRQDVVKTLQKANAGGTFFFSS